MTDTTAVGLPLGLQYIFTSQNCQMFAAALAAHPVAADLKPVEIWAKDSDDPEHRFIHIALQDADGNLIDAEGRRTPAELFQDFGLVRKKPDLREPKNFSPEALSPESFYIRRILNLCGWDRGVPNPNDIRTATGNWSRARDEFNNKNGWNRTPEDVLQEYMVRTLKQRCERVADIVRFAIRDWIADPSQKDVECAGHLNMGPCEEFAGDVEELVRLRFGDKLDMAVETSDEVVEEAGYEAPGDYHAFLRVGKTYYDASCPDGVVERHLLPTVGKILTYAAMAADEDDCSEEEAEDTEEVALAL